jgi:hypothetical protein
VPKPPIFIYSSWRTGGTAFVSCLKANTSNILFYDPLNPALANSELALNSKSDSWSSNHPQNIEYFTEYLPLFSSGKMGLLPEQSHFKFRNSSDAYKTQLVQYLQELINYANTLEKTPIFKFSQLEGHVNLLRSHFPAALHLGLIRDPKDQCDSWLEQLALGKAWFFDNALKLINRDPDFFKKNSNMTKFEYEKVFATYYAGLASVQSELDLTLNLYEDSFDNFVDKLEGDYLKDIFTLAFQSYKDLESRPSFEEKFNRMRQRSLNLVKEKDELMNSTMWRATRPVRKLIDVLKKSS